MNPSISIIIPVYNRGEAIRPTIDSILNQTLSEEEMELLIVDDGSTDGSADWIENFYSDRVRVLRQRNGGVARARNAGLSEARGRYVAFCDHDDVWLPRKLERQLEVAVAHPDAALVGCNWKDVDEHGAEWKGRTWRELYKDWQPARGWVYDWMCASPCPIVSMTLPLLDAEKLRSVGCFDPNCVPCDDWDLYLRLAHRFPFEWVEETLACYVHHPHQQSGNVGTIHKAMKRTLQKQWPDILKHPSSLRFWWSFSRFLDSSSHYYRAKTQLEAGRTLAAWREVARVGLRHPFALSSKQWMYLTFRLARRKFEPY